MNLNFKNKMKNKIALICLFLVSILLFACQSGKEKLEQNILSNEQKLMNDTTKMVNPAVAEEVMKSYKEFAEKYPDDTLAATYLFKAADLSTGIRKFKDAIALYEEFGKKYPSHPKAPVSLFLRAFIYDTNLRDVQNAKMLYSEFIQKYPTHQLTPSAQASLNQLNMGLTDEQLIKLFEAKQDSLARASQ